MCIYALSELISVLVVFVCLFVASMHVTHPTEKERLWKELIS